MPSVKSIHVVRVACMTLRRGDHNGCEDCGGKGWMEIKMRDRVPHPVTPCCSMPWQAALGPTWTCSACDRSFDRKGYIGW